MDPLQSVTSSIQMHPQLVLVVLVLLVVYVLYTLYVTYYKSGFDGSYHLFGNGKLGGMGIHSPAIGNNNMAFYGSQHAGMGGSVDTPVSALQSSVTLGTPASMAQYNAGTASMAPPEGTLLQNVNGGESRSRLTDGQLTGYLNDAWGPAA